MRGCIDKTSYPSGYPPQHIDIDDNLNCLVKWTKDSYGNPITIDEKVQHSKLCHSITIFY